jgi:hypothetical protein
VLLSIDPGVQASAGALFDDGSALGAHLVAAGYDPTITYASGVTRTVTVGLGGGGLECSSIVTAPTWSCVCECPQVYSMAKPPADLVDVAIVVGQWKERTLVAGGTWTQVLPREWKGQHKKPPHHKRVWAALSAAEREIVSKAVGHSPESIAAYIEKACVAIALHAKVTYSRHSHNVLDAVGIGLKTLGRIQ